MLSKIYEITFDTDETIVASTMSKSHEIIMLMSSGDVVRFNLKEKKGEKLFSVKSYDSDGGFDITAETSIYTLDEIVVVVNDFKREGFVHYPGNYNALHLYRGDYHADISAYPIGLYKSKVGIPHLIFGQDWNHIQIMNLDTRQILTATKSLIEEGAEEQEHYDKQSPWPRTYDYFFGKLYISPDQKYFLSAGWTWYPADWYNIYDIELFIKSNRISDISTGAWDHVNRATCWVDNETIAVLYNPHIDGGDDETADSCEIHLYKLDKKSTNLYKEMPIEHKELSSKMYFSQVISSFVILSKEEGLSIFSLEGEILFKDRNLKANEFNIETGLFLVISNVTITIYGIVE